MSAFNGAHSVRGGYNQSGGAYFVCVTALSGSTGTGTDAVTTAVPLATTSSHLYKINAAASKSGGAFEPATLTRVSAQEVFGATTAQAGNAALEFAAGKLIKDMGKTIVGADKRTYRKFAVVATGNDRFVNSFGVAGAPATAPGAGYATFYLDVGREGQTGTTIPAPIARYF
jgi:hypothetical protein